MLKHAKAIAQLPSARVEYLLAGEGSPPIVLINGGDGPIEGWYKILPRLCAASKTLAYNRAGVGRSDRSGLKQTSNVVVDHLRQLIGHLGLPPPYLLVGHSLGGLHANYFARTYPNEICGLVLLDATAPDDVQLMAAYQPALQRGVQSLVDWLFDRHLLGEARNASASARLVQAAGPFPEVPVSVITGGAPSLGRLMPKGVKDGRLINQQRLSRLSSRGCHIIAERSGHFPQFSEPALVVATILEVLNQVRGVTPRGR